MCHLTSRGGHWGTKMLELKLREEFRGKRLKGTTVDFINQSKTGALEVPAAEFLRITYPSIDLLKTIEATGPGHSRPVVLLGSRGQGKSHLLAALYHLCTDASTGGQWLAEWAERLPESNLAAMQLRSGCCVIAESLHLQRYKYGSSDGRIRGSGCSETSCLFWGSMIPLLCSGGVVMARECRTQPSPSQGIHHWK